MSESTICTYTSFLQIATAGERERARESDTWGRMALVENATARCEDDVAPHAVSTRPMHLPKSIKFEPLGKDEMRILVLCVLVRVHILYYITYIYAAQ